MNRPFGLVRRFTLVMVLLAGGCETTTSPAGTEPAADLTGAWRGYVWPYAGSRYDLTVWLYQRSGGELTGDFGADTAFCVASGEVSGHVSGTDVRLKLSGSNGAIDAAGTVYVESSGRAREMEMEYTGAGWCGGRSGSVRLTMERAGW
ncbi:MAG: hypothetical protein HY039_00955 [Nitrospirae bacterium]|nr:hypothetical protein [Nitrospirota bacterium]